MTISLIKGQNISLEKTDGGNLQQVIFAVGWSSNKKQSFWSGLLSLDNGIDLDASAILLDEKNQYQESVYFGQLTSKNNCLVHSGDDRSGKSKADNEVITVDLARLSDSTKTIIFTVNSFSGETFDQVDNAYCRLIDQQVNKEIAKCQLTAKGSHTGIIMAKIYRHNGGWKMQMIDEYLNGRTYKELIPSIIASL